MKVTLFAFCVSLLVVFSSNTASARMTRNKDAASKAFDEGTRLYQKLEYKAAMKAFRLANELHPHFLVICSIARCHEHLGELVKASAVYKRCLREGGDRSNKAEKIRSALAGVESRIGRLKLESHKSNGTVYINGKAMGKTPKDVRLDPGHHTLEVRWGNERSKVHRLTINKGEKRTILFAPQQQSSQDLSKALEDRDEDELDEDELDEDRRGLASGWFWVGTGFTIALTVATTICGALTLKANSDYKDDPTEARFNEVLDKRMLTNIFLGLTLGTAGASTVLYFFTDFTGNKGRPSETLTLNLPRYFGIGMKGTF